MLERLVAFCLRWPWTVVLLTLALTGGGVYLTVTRFDIDTDTVHLFSSKIPWRQNETALYKAFPQLDNLIVAVIDADTPEKADDAAKRLNAALQGKPPILRAWRPDEHEFFRQNGILFLDQATLQREMGILIAQRELMQPLAEDPSLRGLSSTLLSNMKQVGTSQRGLAMMSSGLDQVSTAFEAVLAGKEARVSWEKLLSGGGSEQTPAPADAPTLDKRRIVLISPVIDFSALQPGADAIALVRKTAADLKLTKSEGATVRLTGQTPLADEEFATVAENMELNIAGTLAVVTAILFAALRSPKLIFAVLATLLAGLALTSGLGILVVGRFNMISVAFAALFIGLGVDFGIQFATRYREERHNDNDLERALLAATSGIGGSLTLAAVALLAGFFCFWPTEFLGVSELGLIAGLGMIIAYVATLTFLPAAIKLLKPRAERVPVKQASLASIDHWIARHRPLVLLLTAMVVLGGAPFLRHLVFDSNPMNLRNQKVESVSTFLDLAKDPKTAPNTIEILAPSLDAMRELAKTIAALPEVDHVTTIDTLLPKDQDEKVPLLEHAVFQLRGVLDPKIKPAPSDAEIVAALTRAGNALRRSGPKAKIPPAVTRFAAALEALAKASPRDPRSRASRRLRRFRAHIGRAAHESQSQARHAPVDARRPRERLDFGGRQIPDRGRAQGRQQRPRGHGRVRRKRAKNRAGRDRPAHRRRRGRQDRGARLPAFGRLRLRRDFRDPGRRPEARDRCGLDARTAGAGGNHEPGGGRHARHVAELRQYHRAAADVRGRRRLPHLLRHRLAQGGRGYAGLEPHPRHFLQRPDDRNGVRESVSLEPSRHRQHGRISGDFAVLHPARGLHRRSGVPGPASDARDKIKRGALTGRLSFVILGT